MSLKNCEKNFQVLVVLLISLPVAVDYLTQILVVSDNWIGLISNVLSVLIADRCCWCSNYHIGGILALLHMGTILRNLTVFITAVDP